MTKHLRIAKTAAAYGEGVAKARHHLRHGFVSDARWYAKHARADLRQLLALTGQVAPAPHATADDFFRN